MRMLKIDLNERISWDEHGNKFNRNNDIINENLENGFEIKNDYDNNKKSKDIKNNIINDKIDDLQSK